MTVNTKVICINDQFDALVLSVYKQLPKKDGIYTIRDMILGKSIKGEEGEVAVLLKEIKNPTYNDSLFENFIFGSEHELAFNQERFREIEPPRQENKEEVISMQETEERELVEV